MILLPSARGKAPVNRVHSIYADMYKSVYGIYPSWSTAGMRMKIFKDLLNEYTELQLVILIIAFFKTDDRFVKEKGYTVPMFKYKIDDLIPLIRVKEGLMKEFDGSDELLPIIRENILKLSTD